MELPPPLARVFKKDLEAYQKEKRMPYVTSIERVAVWEALHKGIATALRIRFSDDGLKLMPEIREIYEAEKLEAILTALETAASPDEVRRLWSPGTP